MKAVEKVLPMAPCKRCTELTDGVVEAVKHIQMLERVLKGYDSTISKLFRHQG